MGWGADGNRIDVVRGNGKGKRREGRGKGAWGRGTYEAAQDGEPRLEDGDDAEAAGGGEDDGEGARELVRVVRERVEGVAEAWGRLSAFGGWAEARRTCEPDDVEGRAAEPREDVDALRGIGGVDGGEPDVAELGRVNTRRQCGGDAHLGGLVVEDGREGADVQGREGRRLQMV